MGSTHEHRAKSPRLDTEIVSDANSPTGYFGDVQERARRMREQPTRITKDSAQDLLRARIADAILESHFRTDLSDAELDEGYDAMADADFSLEDNIVLVDFRGDRGRHSHHRSQSHPHRRRDGLNGDRGQRNQQARGGRR